MIAASVSAFSPMTFSRSSKSTSPRSVVFTTLTRMPAEIADAAFVPCADDGMRHTSRCSSPRERW